MPAVGRRRHVLDEQIAQAVSVPIHEREIQRPLYLSAQLSRLSFNLPT
jgi:hypothetical protein